MLNKIATATAVFFALLAPFSVSAMDRTTTYTGQNPKSIDTNLVQRNTRIGTGTRWWNESGSNPSDPGRYGNCSTTPVTGLYVAVTGTSSVSDCAVYVLGVDDTVGYGGFPAATGSYLPADPTQFELQGLLPAGTSSTSIGPLAVGSSPGQSIVSLIECTVVTSDTNSQSINIVSSSGVVTATTANRDRVDRPSCQAKAGSSSASPATPTVDSGYVAISAVTVPYGTTTVSTGMVSPQTAQQFFGYAALTAAGATAIDTSSNAQTKSGALTAAGYSFTSSGVGLTGPNAGQAFADDAASGGWNLSVNSSSSQGFRFWKGAPGTTQLAQMTPTGQFNTTGTTGVPAFYGISPATSGGGAVFEGYGGQAGATFIIFAGRTDLTASGVTGALYSLYNSATGTAFTVDGSNNIGLNGGSFKAGSSVYGPTSATINGGISATTIATSLGSSSAGVSIGSSGYQQNAFIISNNTANPTIINTNSLNADGIVCSLYGIATNGLEKACFDTAGDLGIAGTLSQASTIKVKRDIHSVDPTWALEQSRTFDVIDYCLKADSASRCGPNGDLFYHMSYAAERTPAFLAGRHHNQVEPVTLAAFALAATKGLDGQVQRNETNRDLQIDALLLHIKVLYVLVAVLALLVMVLFAAEFRRARSDS